MAEKTLKSRIQQLEKLPLRQNPLIMRGVSAISIQNPRPLEAAFEETEVRPFSAPRLALPGLTHPRTRPESAPPVMNNSENDNTMSQATRPLTHVTKGRAHPRKKRPLKRTETTSSASDSAKPTTTEKAADANDSRNNDDVAAESGAIGSEKLEQTETAKSEAEAETERPVQYSAPSPRLPVSGLDDDSTLPQKGRVASSPFLALEHAAAVVAATIAAPTNPTSVTSASHGFISSADRDDADKTSSNDRPDTDAQQRRGRVSTRPFSAIQLPELQRFSGPSLACSQALLQRWTKERDAEAKRLASGSART
ncbi:hypothetical protein SJAG_00264 [Schizosaccharomyces japonicus yFS275]|uniref:Uncharacterized protein n=1 Tax=Schizosaccharomyces japonicus (strain yFS275 / FY16936) TaxID=402676 RepID=B6JV61_SCHJY|nr:hypothetical protein SJAG_00264 [Schizosaccharomyces japonicus yFS275]EEB05262.1 hypothetical protein SJAG_00264 [Schizosaccharomyces japonicus yFS275]